MRLGDGIGWQEAKCLCVPVDAAATDAVHWHERAPRAYRQRLLAHFVAKGERELRRAQKKLMPDAIAQFVLVEGRRIIGRRVAPWPALDRNHVETFVGQFVRDDRAGPAEADDSHILFG